MLYEGYGPGGVAVMCKAVTDNRNRTNPEIRKIFERSGGSLGSPNCVAFQFQSKGVIVIETDKADEDQLMEIALEAGADDVDSSTMIHEITTTLDAFEVVRDAIKAAGIEIQSADLSMVADNPITLDLTVARKVLRLIDNLEDHDDSDAVYSNADIPDDVVEALAKE